MSDGNPKADECSKGEGDGTESNRKGAKRTQWETSGRQSGRKGTQREGRELNREAKTRSPDTPPRSLGPLQPKTRKVGRFLRLVKAETSDPRRERREGCRGRLRTQKLRVMDGGKVYWVAIYRYMGYICKSGLYI